MSFQINYESGDFGVDAFYPYEGWNRDEPGSYTNENDLKAEQLIEKFIENKKNGEEFKSLFEDFTYREDVDDLLKGVAWFLESCGKLEVEDQSGNTIYADRDYEFLEENPSIREMIPNCVDKEFCLVKISEGKRYGVIYEHFDDDEFNASLLKYSNGKLYYNEEGFEHIGGEGFDTYWEIYIDGIMVYGCGINSYSI